MWEVPSRAEPIEFTYTGSNTLDLVGTKQSVQMPLNLSDFAGKMVMGIVGKEKKGVRLDIALGMWCAIFYGLKRQIAPKDKMEALGVYTKVHIQYSIPREPP